MSTRHPGVAFLLAIVAMFWGTRLATGDAPRIKWLPDPAEAGQEINFFDTGTATYKSYEWAIDGTPLGRQKTFRHTFAKSGTHQVTLRIVDADGQAAQFAAPVPVGETDLTCDFVLPASKVEAGQEVKLQSRVTGNPDSYSWKIGGTEVGTKPEHTLVFDKTGEFEVWLEIRRGAASEISGRKIIHVREPEVRVAIRCPNEAGSGQTLQFMNDSTGPLVSFMWTFGDGKTSTNRVPSHSYTNDTVAAKDFRVTLRARTITGKLVDSLPATVRVLPAPPKASFSVAGNPPYKVGAPIQLTDTSTGWIDSYAWSLGDEIRSSEKSPALTPTSIGEQELCLIVRGPGGSSTNKQTLVIVAQFLPPQIANITASPRKQRMKRGQTVTVTFGATVQGDYESVTWDFGDGGASDQLAPSHIYAVASNYTVRVTARNAANLEGSATVPVIVLPPLPWWYMLPVYIAIALVVWALIIVPFILKPIMLPHKTISIRSTVNYIPRQLAQRGRYTWLWPRNSITIGTHPTDDIHLIAAGGGDRTLAIIKRLFASDNYQLLPQESDSVKLLEKYLVSIPSGQGRILRDGDQICMGEETFSWTFPPKKKD